jgi:hypothetical protein
MVCNKRFSDLRDRASMKQLATYRLTASTVDPLTLEKDQHARPNKSRTEMVEMFVHRMLYQPHQQPPATKTRTAPKPCCVRPLAELEPVTLADMTVNKIHRGRYLICRAISKPIISSEMCVLVEDSNGHCDEVTVSCGFDVAAKPEHILPVHSILLIKEPYLKGINFLSDIRVDSPSDLIVLSDLDRAHPAWPLLGSVPTKWLHAIHPPETLEQLHRLGNASFANKEYGPAVRFYTRELNSRACVEPEERKRALANRAAAFLRMGSYSRACEDACRAAELGKSGTRLDEKVYFRMGEALYAMRQYERASRAFRTCLELNGKCEEAAARVERCERRIAEARTGMYDVMHVIELARNRFEPRMDLADFVSSDVDVVAINGDPNNLGK